MCTSLLTLFNTSTYHEPVLYIRSVVSIFWLSAQPIQDENLTLNTLAQTLHTLPLISLPSHSAHSLVLSEQLALAFYVRGLVVYRIGTDPDAAVAGP